MRRNAFLLGMFSIGGQALLLRELISSFNGDELLIGTALFGWLVAVAIGAFVAGKTSVQPRTSLTSILFILGPILLLVMIMVARLAPMWITGVPGEYIPFTLSAVLSILFMMPVGIVSGMLFPRIAAERSSSQTGVVEVYLFEGIGAFVGGVIITVLIGSLFTNLGAAIITSWAVIMMRFAPKGKLLYAAILVVFHGSMVLIWYLSPAIDGYIENIKYPGYDVRLSTDTHHGHQAVLERESSIFLLTDNTVEATYPDPSAVENQVIAPLLYRPTATRILYVGRPEFGVAQLSRQLPGIELVALDPRGTISSEIDEIIRLDPPTRIDDDPVAFVNRHRGEFDIIILNIGEPGTYGRSRLLTPRFLSSLRQLLADSGLVMIPTGYDTDRYVSNDVSELLGIIHNTLTASFERVSVWPGDQTLFFASVDCPLDLLPDSLVARVRQIEFDVQYLSAPFLLDRLDEFKLDRLKAALAVSTSVNRLDKPILPHYQAVYKAGAGGFDRVLVPAILSRSIWTLIVPVGVILAFIVSLLGSERPRRFGLFLYLVAGVVSLSLELVSFYLYQSTAGSLYAEIAALIGAFMLGLALGTWYASRTVRGNLAAVSLAFLLIAGILFLTTCLKIQPGMTLVYHLLFQFTVALGTGSLFVAATRRYYLTDSSTNRGAGYAVELIGSSIGALLATTVFLPLIGLHWLLWSLCGLLALTLIGSIAISEK